MSQAKPKETPLYLTDKDDDTFRNLAKRILNGDIKAETAWFPPVTSTNRAIALSFFKNFQFPRGKKADDYYYYRDEKLGKLSIIFYYAKEAAAGRTPIEFVADLMEALPPEHTKQLFDVFNKLYETEPKGKLANLDASDLEAFGIVFDQCSKTVLEKITPALWEGYKFLSPPKSCLLSRYVKLVENVKFGDLGGWVNLDVLQRRVKDSAIVNKRHLMSVMLDNNDYNHRDLLSKIDKRKLEFCPPMPPSLALADEAPTTRTDAKQQDIKRITAADCPAFQIDLDDEIFRALAMRFNSGAIVNDITNKRRTKEKIESWIPVVTKVNAVVALSFYKEYKAEVSNVSPIYEGTNNQGLFNIIQEYASTRVNKHFYENTSKDETITPIEFIQSLITEYDSNIVRHAIRESYEGGYRAEADTASKKQANETYHIIVDLLPESTVQSIIRADIRGFERLRTYQEDLANYYKDLIEKSEPSYAQLEFLEGRINNAAVFKAKKGSADGPGHQKELRKLIGLRKQEVQHPTYEPVPPFVAPQPSSPPAEPVGSELRSVVTAGPLMPATSPTSPPLVAAASTEGSILSSFSGVPQPGNLPITDDAVPLPLQPSAPPEEPPASGSSVPGPEQSLPNLASLASGVLPTGSPAPADLRPATLAPAQDERDFTQARELPASPVVPAAVPLTNQSSASSTSELVAATRSIPALPAVLQQRSDAPAGDAPTAATGVEMAASSAPPPREGVLLRAKKEHKKWHHKKADVQAEVDRDTVPTPIQQMTALLKQLDAFKQTKSGRRINLRVNFNFNFNNDALSGNKSEESQQRSGLPRPGRRET